MNRHLLNSIRHGSNLPGAFAIWWFFNYLFSFSVWFLVWGSLLWIAGTIVCYFLKAGFALHLLGVAVFVWSFIGFMSSTLPDVALPGIFFNALNDWRILVTILFTIIYALFGGSGNDDEDEDDDSFDSYDSTDYETDPVASGRQLASHDYGP
jgi:membrane-bound ClpP family serine protease